MAIARANCTCATCGKAFEVRVHRSTSREARSFEEWAAEHITECDDCKAARIQAAHDAENAEAAKAAQEMGYPELKGTEKQAAWANTIREKALALLQEKCLAPDVPEKYMYIRLAYEPSKALLLGMRQAAWWIEHRNIGEDMLALTRALAEINKPLCETVSVIQKAVKAGEKTMAQAEAEIDAMISAPPEAKAEAKPEAPNPQAQPAPERPEAQPKNRKHEGAADVKVSGAMVTALYSKDESFRDLVKGMGFAWKDGRWQIESTERNGAAADICAELGSRLLNAGFAVRFDSRELMDKAVTGDYTPMCRRWIMSNSRGFYITWGREDDHYRAAKSLPGASYDSPGVIVPERSWDALTDFATKYGYRFTAKAQEKLDHLSGMAQAVAPAPVKKPEYLETDVLKSSREVLDDLKD